MIGWSYERRIDGICSREETLELYPKRYINPKVEEELIEFKDEI